MLNCCSCKICDRLKVVKFNHTLWKSKCLIILIFRCDSAAHCLFYLSVSAALLTFYYNLCIFYSVLSVRLINTLKSQKHFFSFCTKSLCNLIKSNSFNHDSVFSQWLNTSELWDPHNYNKYHQFILLCTSVLYRSIIQ